MTRDVPRLLRFGVFEADLAARTLRKAGVRIRVQEQPFRVLAMLLARPGEVVTREELQQELWPDEEYGEFDLGLNTAVKKLRQALNDSADSPRWIETVPKVGYKFLGPVEDGSAAPVSSASVEEPAPSGMNWVWPVAAVCFALLAAFAWLRGGDDPGERQVVRFSVEALQGALVRSFEVSPDGRNLVFVADEGNQVRLWLRPLRDEAARPLEGTRGCDPLGAPFWSPDSRYVGFFAEGKLKKVGINGEPPVELADAPNGRGGSWSEDGVILFAPTNHGPGAYIMTVSDQGGEVRTVSRQEREGLVHRSPQFLPDGERFLYFDRLVGPMPMEGGEVRVAALDDPESVVLANGRGHGAFVSTERGSPGDYLLTVDQGVLLATPLDVEAGRLVGDAIAIARGVGVDLAMNRGLFSVSSTGVLAYAAENVPVPVKRLTWVDRSGNALEAIGPEAQYVGLRIGPERAGIAVQTGELMAGYEFGVVEAANGTLARPAPGFTATSVAWNPRDGALLFAQGSSLTYSVSADGASAPELLLRREADIADVSRDGEELLFYSAQGDILVASKDSATEPSVFVSTQARVRQPRFSPSGKLIAYSSDESGVSEVYVRPYPKADGRSQASTGGGSEPVWSADGSELYYVSPEDDLMAVSVGTGPRGRLQLGVPETLFKLERDLGPFGTLQRYDVGEDGGRFLVARTIRSEPSPIHVVLNWDLELARLVEQSQAR